MGRVCRSNSAPISTILTLIASGVCAGATACSAHERVGRPPSANEVGFINQRAAIHGPLDVELRSSRAPLGGSWARIESADAYTLTLRATDGHIQTIPLETVTGVSLQNRERGMFVGAVSVGAISGLMGWGLAAAFKEGTCSWDCAGLAGIGLGTGALAGVAIGYLVGGRTVFTFE